MDKFWKKFSSVSGGIAMLIAAAVAINIIGSKANLKVDVTGDQLFTLSESTEKLLNNLEGDVTAKFYFSSSLKETPVLVKTYANRVEELLREYSHISGGKIKVEAIDPRPDTDEEEWARKFGVSNVNLGNGEELFFGLVFIQGTNEQVIPYFDPRREEFLEYDLTEALVRVFDQEKTKVGIYSGLPIWGMPQAGQPSWAAVSELEKSFEVVNLEQNFDQINETNVTVLIHPKDLTEEQQYKIDQFVLNGGRLVVLVDPFSRVDLAQAAQNPETQRNPFGYEPKSNLVKLFASWGIEFTHSALVGDVKFGTPIATQTERFTYPFFISVTPEGFSKENILTSKLPSFLFAEGGSFKLKPDSPYKFEPLIETSSESGTQEPRSLQYTGPAAFAKSFKPTSGKQILAGLLTGSFKTAFPGGLKDQPGTHKETAEKETTILLVGDTDFIHDSNAADRFRFGNQVIVRPKNGNLSFFVNAVEYLGGRDELIAIRSRGKVARPFVKLMEIQREAQEKWQGVEESLSKKITEVQNKINDMQKERTDGNKFLALSPEQEQEIARFREEEVKARKERREVRKNLREDIESLERKIIFANMIILPIGVFLMSLFVFSRRNRRLRKED